MNKQDKKHLHPKIFGKLVCLLCKNWNEDPEKFPHPPALPKHCPYCLGTKKFHLNHVDAGHKLTCHLAIITEKPRITRVNNI